MAIPSINNFSAASLNQVKSQSNLSISSETIASTSGIVEARGKAWTSLKPNLTMDGIAHLSIIGSMVLGTFLALTARDFAGIMESVAISVHALSLIFFAWAIGCACQGQYSKAATRLVAAGALGGVSRGISELGKPATGRLVEAKGCDTLQKIQNTGDALNPTQNTLQSQGIGKVFFFVPPNPPMHPMTFFSQDDQRLNIFETAIQAIQNATDLCAKKEDYICLVIAPEDWLNPDLNTYYSQQEKDLFFKRMIEVSQTTHLVIAPGTFNWVSEKEKVKEYYRTFYLFHDGQHRRFDKHFFFPKEYDVLRDPSFDKTPVTWFDPTSQDLKVIRFEGDPVQELGGISFGMEVCYDHEKQVLDRHLESHPRKIDVQLLVSNFLPTAYPVQQNSSFLLVHAATNKQYCQAAIVGDTSDSVLDQVFFYDFSKFKWVDDDNLTAFESIKRLSASEIDQMAEERNQLFLDQLRGDHPPKDIYLFKQPHSGFFEWLGERGDFNSAEMAISKILSNHLLINSDVVDRHAYYYSLMVIDFQADLTTGSQHLLTAGIDTDSFASSIHQAFSTRKRTQSLFLTALRLPPEKQNHVLLRKLYNKCGLTTTETLSPEQRKDFAHLFLKALENSQNVELALELKQRLDHADSKYFDDSISLFPNSPETPHLGSLKSINLPERGRKIVTFMRNRHT